MKKTFFNVIAALALVCGVSDINSLNERLDELETGQIASLEEQIATLSSALEDAKTAITALEGSTSDLETAKEDLLSQIEELNKKIEVNDGDIAELISQVAELEAEVARIDGLEKDLKALEETVEEIENNYLTKEEAQSTYATLKAVADLESALSGVEGRLDNLETVELPAVKNAIEAAQKDASEALGKIDALVEALGGYSEAGTLNKIDELDVVDSTLKANIEALNDSLKANVEALREEIASTKEEILSLVVSKEELPALVEEQIRKAIEEENGRINQAISDAIKEVTNNLMSQIEDLSDRLEDVEAAMEDLTKRIEAAEGEIDDLANRIQSLVFVPEYNDGKATVLSYTINDVAVSDNMVVTATFQVTPAALAENVINQYEDNVFAYVLPVLTRSSSDIAYIASAENSSLVLQKGKRDGFIDAEITVPVKTEDGVELTPGGFAISLYVASKEEVDAIVSGEETVVDMDAGTYVTSDYIQTAGKVTALDNAYVLYNETAEREYPTSADESENEVNYYERAWSVLNRAVSFYGDNNYDDVDDGSYTLHIKLDGEYYTLEEAAAMFRADVADITPGYDYIAQYYDRFDMASQELAEYFTVDEEEPYGLSVDMAKESAMTNVIGSYVFAMNTFSFDNDSRYGNLTVLDNVGRYKVINLPININIDADRVDWTYDFALAHADDSDNPTEPNFQPITNTLQYTAENLGEMSLADILTLTPASTEVRLGDSEEPIATDAPVITFGDVASDTDSTGTIGISVNGYDFSSETENVYHFTNTYYLEDYQVNCTVNFTLTLGTMPGDQFVNYNQLPRDIQFMLPGSGDTDIIGIDNGYSLAFKQLNKLNPEWFADEAQLTASMQMNDLTTYSSYVDGTALYEGVQHTEQSQVYTRLSVEPTAEYADGSFVRVSSSQIAAVGNVFDFITEVDTWYGVTYTFTNEGKVGAPEFELSYIPTHIYDLNGEQPYVQLDYHLNANGSAYVIDEANLRNYFNVTDIPDGFNGHLTVEFEVLTQENPAEGYANVPSIPVLNVNNTTGALGEYTINWTRYTARDLQIRATLVAAANELTSEKISLNSLDLGIRVYPLVENAEMKGADDVDYFGNNLVMDDEGYIVVNRESNETVMIRLWEYVNAYARFSNGENFIPYENAQGSRHESLVYVNQNQAMKLYGAELVLDDNYDAMSGDIRREIEYSSTNGTVIYRAEDGEIANPIYITVEGHLNYYLDYNHVGSYPVTVKIKLQDAE